MLAELKSHHQEIGRLKFEGFKSTEIADKLDMAVTTVYQILRDPLCKAFVNGLSDKANTSVIDVRKKLANMQGPALDVINSILTGGTATAPAAVRLAASKDVLDRNGHKPVERKEHLHGHFTAEDLVELRNRQKSMGV